MNNPITMLIVDDHEVVRRGIRAAFAAREEFSVLGEAASGAEAIEMVEKHIPDVVLMDLVMPEMDGVETTRRIKKISPRSQIVMLTSFHEDEHIFPALQAGALSYILKDIHISELAEAVKKAAQGEPTLHPRVAARVVQEFHSSGKNEYNPFTDLTNREVEILKLIANGMTNAEITEKLVLSEYTVKGHVSNILSKLHLADRTKAAVFAWQKGIVRRD